MNRDAYKEDVLPVTFKVNAASNIYKKFAKFVMNETTYQEDVMPMTFKGNVVLKNAYQKDVLTMTLMENVVRDFVFHWAPPF